MAVHLFAFLPGANIKLNHTFLALYMLALYLQIYHYKL